MPALAVLLLIVGVCFPEAHAALCARCEAGQYASTACTPTSNRVCTACPSGTFSASLNAGSCQSCSTASCPPGSYISTPCSSTRDKRCSPCVLGSSFSDTSDALACAPCIVCGTYGSACNRTNDATCVSPPSGSASARFFGASSEISYPKLSGALALADSASASHSNTDSTPPHGNVSGARQLATCSPTTDYNDGSAFFCATCSTCTAGCVQPILAL